MNNLLARLVVIQSLLTLIYELYSIDWPHTRDPVLPIGRTALLFGGKLEEVILGPILKRNQFLIVNSPFKCLY
jgi:hypothetical protein